MSMRPAILWGLDPPARSIAEKFLESLAARGVDVKWLRTLDPGEDAIRSLRRIVAELKEQARAQGSAVEPGLILLASAFEPEAEARLELVRAASGVIETALAGAQSITLAALLPPALAEDRAKICTFDFFCHLEELAGDVRFLDLVFVNQLTQQHYRNPAAGGPEARELQELLYQELLDPDLEHTIRGRCSQPIATRQTVAGRKCCYSTVGVYDLIYLAGEAMDWLRARFESELFHRGLLDPDALSDQDLAAVQARVDQFVAGQLAALREKAPQAAAVAGGGWSQAAPPDQMDQQRLVFDEEVNRALSGEGFRLDQALESLDGRGEKELRDFLPCSPRYLAGAQRFLRALEGERQWRDPAEKLERPSGARQFKQEFCLDPFRRALEDVFEPRLTAALAPFQVPAPPREEESRLEWLSKAIRPLGRRLEEIEPGLNSPARFYVAAFETIRTHIEQRPADVPAARELVSDLSGKFRDEAGRLFEKIRPIREDQEQKKAELARFGWFARNLTRRSEHQAKQLEIAGLDSEILSLSQRFGEMRALLLDLVNQAALPYFTRARVNAKFRDEVEQAVAGFRGFVAAIAGPLGERWSRARRIAEFSHSTAATVLSESRLEILYARTLGSRSMTEVVELALAFFPGQRAEEASYRECRSLKDHYAAGPRPLLDRMRDYSAALFAPVAGLGAIDLVEIEGQGPAERYLADKVEKAKRFLEYSSGMVPLVANRQAAGEMFVVRSSAANNARLEQGYRRLLEPQQLFLDSGNPNLIRITWLMFGFPAFLLQLLHEARSLEPPERDLWPRESP